MKKKNIFALVLAFALTLSFGGVMAEYEDVEIEEEPIYEEDLFYEQEQSDDETSGIFDKVEDDVSVIINLENNNCSVSVDGVDSDSIVVDPLTTISVLLLATPDEGYRFESWNSADGTVLSKENPYNMTVVSSTDVIAVCVEIDADDVDDIDDATKGKYIDVEGHWAKDNITRAVEAGLFSGVSENRFDPDSKTTRGMIITLMARLNGVDLSGYTESAFEDVEISDYYGAATAWGSENGLVTGTSETKFDPNGELTREQIAAILFRYAKLVGADITATADISSFSDYKDVSGYAVEAVSWANQAGIINGSDGNKLNPLGTASRAEVATMLVRYSDRFAAEMAKDKKDDDDDDDDEISVEVSETNDEDENKAEEATDDADDADDVGETDEEGNSDSE